MSGPRSENQDHAERVYKYRLPSPNEEPWVEVPKGSKFLHVAAQDGIPYVWALVCPWEPLRRRYIQVYATGQPIDGYPDYLGTFHIDWTVWHVFASTADHPLGAPPKPKRGDGSGTARAWPRSRRSSTPRNAAW